MTIKVTYNVTDVYMSQSVSPVYINVSYSDGGTSGGGVWGSITGTLSNQTDLQTALDLKLDESTIDGGTEGQILSKASATDFDFAWINNYAKYLATNVRNQTGSTIGAFQVVYISGATGNKPLISLADADTEATSSKTYGVTATSIANNGTGDVVTAGELSGINTSAFNEGDLLWLSTTAGGVVTTPPAEPAHAVFIGYVVRSHPTLGVIDVSIQNGYELNELHGVQITTPTDNQGLFYNSTSTLWENKSITTALGYTPVPTTRNITINGVTYDLSADRTWTIAAGISGSGASGQVTYWTGASSVSGSNNLFWDNANGRLGIGTNAPSSILDIQPSTGSPTFRIARNSGADFRIGSSTLAIGALIGTYSAAPISLVANSATVGTITSGGNFILGVSTDAGQRLQVYGDTLLRGSGNTSATTALTVQNSSSINMWRFQNDGDLLIGTSGVVTIRPNNGTITSPQLIGLGMTLNIGLINAGSGVIINNANGERAATSGVSNTLLVQNGFAPTSGTGQFNMIVAQGTINQQGGANGITRGLYVNPTLTAAADWRSIEWSNNSGYGLYGAGTAPNMILGPLSIGETSIGTNILNIRANLTGSTIYNSVRVASLALSDVTNIASAFRSEMGTQNATFTLSTLAHFHARQGSLGASSTVTNQYGFWAVSNLTGATNNYGFVGDIPSGTGRWNLYMGGTADNYLAGNLGIGITPTVRLQVSGDTILRGSGATSATTALTVQNSSSTNLLTVRNDGAVAIGTTLSAWSGSTTPLQISGGAFWNFGSTNIYLGLNYYYNGSSRIYIQSAAASEYRQASGGHYWYSAISGTAGGTVSFTETMRLNIDGYLGIGTTVPTALTHLGASTTTRASLRISSGTAPTTPNDGDIWFDGTDIKMRIGGVTKTFTLI